MLGLSNPMRIPSESSNSRPPTTMTRTLTQRFPKSAKVDWITYAGLEASPEIYVDAVGKEGYVRAPWATYSGVRVDQHYLYVFGWGGFACATHASVMRCLTGGGQTPRWIHHYPNELLFTEAYHRNEKRVFDRPPPLGLVDLSPCDDGPAAALYTRTVLAPGALEVGHSSSSRTQMRSTVGFTQLTSRAATFAWSGQSSGQPTEDAVHKVARFLLWSTARSLMGSLETLEPDMLLPIGVQSLRRTRSSTPRPRILSNIQGIRPLGRMNKDGPGADVGGGPSLLR